MDHGDDQAAEVGIQQGLQIGLVVGPLDRNVLLLHLAQQALDPALQLAFQFGAVHHQDHRRMSEARLVLQDQPRGRQQGEGLAGTLGMPDQSACLGRIGAAVQDRVDGSLLMLTQHRLARLAILHVEKDPVLQGTQKFGRLEEGLHGEAVAFLRRLLPAGYVAPVRVPRHPIPVVQQVGDIEELGRRQQFWRFQLVAP